MEQATLTRSGATEHFPTGGSESADFSMGQLRAAVLELFTAVTSALEDERESAEESLTRAANLLRESPQPVAPSPRSKGGLAPWQVRKITSYIEANLDGAIRSDDLAASVRLNACHFSRAFRSTFGVPPLQYVAKRRMELAQGLMLTSDAPLSQIALECGCSDQAHFSRLFRRFVGETPRDWRRARMGHVEAHPSAAAITGRRRRDIEPESAPESRQPRRSNP